MNSTLAVIALYGSAAAYIAVVVGLALCLITKRCAGIDEHAMIPGDPRLPDAANEVKGE